MAKKKKDNECLMVKVIANDLTWIKEKLEEMSTKIDKMSDIVNEHNRCIAKLKVKYDWLKWISLLAFFLGLSAVFHNVIMPVMP
ncbi:MAG TPA: hypothetical protein ENF41_04390 [Candidatus Bathyarchaeota archaeon]|nr:hypothetical protein [Candidatus Bathyarchaeota archaeon]